MSGPIRTLSQLTDEVLSHTRDVNSVVDRLRRGSRNLTGGTGEAPTPLVKGDPQQTGAPEVPPVMVRLTMALGLLSHATATLNDEMNYLEQFTETAPPANSVDVGAAKAYR